MFLTGYEHDYEHDNCIFTVYGMLDHWPPRELAGMLAFAGELRQRICWQRCGAANRSGPW